MDFESLKVQNTQASAPQMSDAVKKSAPVKTSNTEGVKVSSAREAEKSVATASETVVNGEEKSKEEKAKEYTENEVKSMIKAVNEKLSLVGKHFEYKVHDVTKQLMIKVVDSTTKEVIKEIPPEKGQDAVAKLWELAGILVDEKR